MTYDVACPICGRVNRRLYLEETEGWMECEYCGTSSQHFPFANKPANRKSEMTKRIQELRKNKGMIQEDLAPALYISIEHLKKLETGKRRPSFELLVFISEYFDVSIDYLLTGQDPGISRYQGNHYIVSIIERAISADPYSRFASVTAMKKQMEHEFGARLIDRIPLLRTVPGFRTHTLWKEIIAGLSYSTVLTY